MEKRKRLVVAVIDTGIGQDISYWKDITGNITFFLEDKTIYLSDKQYDAIGHGTQVASCIKKYCPQTELFIINIYKDSRIVSSCLLLEALRYLLDVDVDIINISLAVSSREYVSDIESVLQLLGEQGKCVVASVKNGQESSYPASSPYCIGVSGSEKLSAGEFGLGKRGEYMITASRLPEQVESLGGRMAPFGGNSRAAACITGRLAAVMMEKSIYRTGMESAYMEMAKYNFREDDKEENRWKVW